MAGENVQIEMNADQETPDQKTAREAAEAAALAKGEQVSIEHRDKRDGHSGNNIKIAAGSADAPQRPDNVPEKFWNEKTGEVNLEALLKSQADGAAEISRLQQSGVEKPAPETPAKDETPGAPDDAIDQASAVQKASDEFAQNGSLSSATYETLAKTGLSKDMVDTYIGAQTERATALKTATFDAAGGEQQFNTMAEWATENMPAAQVAAVNTLLASTDPQVAAQGAAQLKTFYDANADIDPANQLAGHGNKSSGEMFNSKHELTEAMRDPRYSKDAAFRATVAQKIARSSAAGVDIFS